MVSKHFLNICFQTLNMFKISFCTFFSHFGPSGPGLGLCGDASLRHGDHRGDRQQRGVALQQGGGAPLATTARQLVGNGWLVGWLVDWLVGSYYKDGTSYEKS